MRLSLKPLACIVTGIILGLPVAWCPVVRGQDQDRSGQGASAREKSDRGERRERAGETAPGAASQSLEGALKAYQEYREGTVKNVEQTRKEIDRMVHELTDLIAMRFRMSLALASHRVEAELQAQAQAAAASPGQKSEQKEDKESSIVKSEAVCRELEQLQAQLRSEISQARAQAEQLAAQIRSVRQQQREAERSTSAQGDTRQQERERDSR